MPIKVTKITRKDSYDQYLKTYLENHEQFAVDLNEKFTEILNSEEINTIIAF